MITLSSVDAYIKEFDCITTDITNNNHLPDSNGMLCGVKVENGDILYNMDNGDTYKWDGENKKWLPQ